MAFVTNIVTDCIKTCRKRNEERKKRRQEPPAFGDDMRREEFTFEEGAAFLNQGANGAVPRRVQEARQGFIDEFNANPDIFWSVKRSQYVEEATVIAAPFLGSDQGNLVFVENVTEGISNVMRSVPFQSGDVIIFNNFTYPAMKNAIQQALDITPGLESYEIHHSIPISSTDVIVQQYEDALDAHPNAKLALIDHIASFGLLFPIQQIVDVCKARGVLSLVDGAHCPGQLHLNLEELAADFYIGDYHKWLYTPRGCGIQWVAPQHHDMMRPAITSFGYDSPYPTPFDIQGLRDVTPYAAAKAAMEFVEWIGGIDAKHVYADQLFSVGLPLLTDAWSTALIDAPPEMFPPMMRLIRLPPMAQYPPSALNARLLSARLGTDYAVWCSVSYYGGVMYVRVCVNVYATIADFERLRDAVLDIASQPPRHK